MASQSNGTCACEHCGQRIRKLNPHRMDRKKVQMLEYIAKQEGWVTIKAGRTPGFNGEDQVFAMRLEWFGLVEHGEKRSGLYKVTEKGVAFLRGRVSVPATIYCKEGRVVETSDEQVFVSDVRHVVLDREYWDNYAAIQRSGYKNPGQSGLGI